MIPAKRLQSHMEDGTIQIAPLDTETTLDRAVILDEAQNTSQVTQDVFTRMGSDGKFIVTGDPTQIDFLINEIAALYGIEIVKNIRGISIIQLTATIFVRHLSLPGPSMLRRLARNANFTKSTKGQTSS